MIEACKLARRAIENALHGQPDMTADPIVQQRKQGLIREAEVALAAIRQSAETDVADPLTDPATLARAVVTGILDAPHLCNNVFARGEIKSRIDSRGACVAIDPVTGNVLPEQRRIARLVLRHGSGARSHPKRPVSTKELLSSFRLMQPLSRHSRYAPLRLLRIVR